MTAGKWTIIQNKGTEAELTFKPASAVSYYISVIAYDGSGLQCEKQFKLQAFTSLKNKSEISADNIGFGDSRGVVVNKTFSISVTKPEKTSRLVCEEIAFGSNIEVLCSVEGGAVPYQYAVMYKKASSDKWSVKQNYSDNNTVLIKPASKTKYDVCVKVKDRNGSLSKVYFVVTVK